MYYICAKILHAIKVDDPVDAVPIHAVFYFYNIQKGMWTIRIILCRMVFSHNRDILWIWCLLMGCLSIRMHLFYWMVCSMAYCIYINFECS